MARALRASRFAAGVLGAVALTLAGLLLVTFLIGRVMPIDPVVAVVGDKASPETYAAAREKLGLDQPLAVQFGRYIVGVVQGDLGVSTVSNRPVAEEIGRVFPATIELATLGIIIGVFAGVPLGVYAAHRQNQKVRKFMRCCRNSCIRTSVRRRG